jgi:hypothetical protein
MTEARSSFLKKKQETLIGFGFGFGLAVEAQPGFAKVFASFFLKRTCYAASGRAGGDPRWGRT